MNSETADLKDPITSTTQCRYSILQIKLGNDSSQTEWAIIRSSKACTKPRTTGHETHDKIFQTLSLIFWGGAWVRGWGCCSYWSNAVLASLPGLPHLT